MSFEPEHNAQPSSSGYRSKGDGRDFSSLGEHGPGVVLEAGVRVFHPHRVFIEAGVYIGHDTILEGYHAGDMRIGRGSWVGAQCFFHAAGNLTIGEHVGIGPGTRILTSVHQEAGRHTPILHAPLTFAPVIIGCGSDLGAGCTILPGVTVGQGAQVGAGAVVTRDVPAFSVVAGSPARLLRMRRETGGE